jgi:WD40 repeat protein
MKLNPREELKGHTAEIEGVCFCPNDKFKLASVGDDKKLIIWDIRTFEKKALEVYSILCIS